MPIHRAPRAAPPRPSPTISAPLGECTRDTQRCADARDYHAILRPCCRAHLIQIVADTVAFLEEHQITFWLDYGTLLGAVRNPLTTWADYPWLPHVGDVNGPINAPLAPGIIPHDKDADFGVLWSDWEKLMQMRAALQRKGYDVIARPTAGMVKIRLSAINQTNLDLFCWREKVGGAFYRTRYIVPGVDAYKGRDIPAGMLFPLSTVDWEGMTLAAPKDPMAFCAFRYGLNWKTPIAANHDGVRR